MEDAPTASAKDANGLVSAATRWPSRAQEPAADQHATCRAHMQEIPLAQVRKLVASQVAGSKPDVEAAAVLAKATVRLPACVPRSTVRHPRIDHRPHAAAAHT